MEILVTMFSILGILSNIAVLFLLWDSVRSRFLKCKIGNEDLPVPQDEVKECFRRSALAAVSAKYGGRRVNLTSEWKGSTLHIKIVE